MTKATGRTPAFKDSRGAVIAGSVAEAGTLAIGGLDQWLLIRGRSSANPLLIVLHGGPGSPETAPLRAFNAALEDAYLVVYWDQRGAGRSYAKTIPPQSMTTEQFLADLDELVHAMLARFGQRKVVLLGHSWGSYLGTIYAARHPGEVWAYVGVGQVADMVRSERESYAFALGEAERRGHRTALAALRKIGPPPYAGLSDIGVQRRWLSALGGAYGPGFTMGKLIWRSLATPEASPLDLVRMVRGSNFTLKHMLAELLEANLQPAYVRFDVPVFFILGRHDHQAVATVAADYFEAIEAPHKQLFWLENSGHMIPFEEPAEFNRLLTEVVRTHVAGLQASSEP